MSQFRGITAHVSVIDEDNTSGSHVLDAGVLAGSMGYFATVLARYGPSLESKGEVHITVHCKTDVFAAILDYIASPPHSWVPPSDPRLTLGISVSARFLGIPDLVSASLASLASSLPDLLALPLDLSCLHDDDVAVLAAAQTPPNLLALADPRGSLLERMYAARVSSLTADRGLGLCSLCDMLVHPTANSGGGVCPKATPIISRSGKLVRNHNLGAEEKRRGGWEDVLDTLMAAWDSWERVYWAIYAVIHHMECSICGALFNLTQFGACKYHPGSYARNGTGYSCCTASPSSAPGCASKPHIPSLPPQGSDQERVFDHHFAVLAAKSVAISADAPVLLQALRAISPPPPSSSSMPMAMANNNNNQNRKGKGGRSGRGKGKPGKILLSKRIKKLPYSDLVKDIEWTTYVLRDRDKRSYAQLRTQYNLS